MSYSCDILFLISCWCGCWLRCFLIFAKLDDVILLILFCFSFEDYSRYFFTIFSCYFINFLYFYIFSYRNIAFFTFLQRTILYYLSIKCDCFFLFFRVLIYSIYCYFYIFIDFFI